MKFSKIFNMFFTLISLVFLIVACEGPEGPAGPAGKDGKDGKDGTDGTEKCSACHNMSTDLSQKIMQWKESLHATGTSWSYAGTRACQPCHSTEGFQQYVANPDGEITPPAYATPLGCRGCHTVHKNYDITDFEPVITAPVKFKGDLCENKTYDQGKGNLCAVCHQTRSLNINWEGPEINITSTHWGPHHGPQSNLLAGTGFYTFGQTLPSSPHGSVVSDGCVQCHMVNEAHTFEANIAACTPCHTDAKDFNIDGVQDEFEQLYGQLTQALLDKGLIAGDEEEGYHPVTGTVPTTQAGAVFNWAGLGDDGSKGVHNPKYIKTLLQASIDALK